jgi:hypothetical protein
VSAPERRRSTSAISVPSACWCWSTASAGSTKARLRASAAWQNIPGSVDRAFAKDYEAERAAATEKELSKPARELGFLQATDALKYYKNFDVVRKLVDSRGIAEMTDQEIDALQNHPETELGWGGRGVSGLWRCVKEATQRRDALLLALIRKRREPADLVVGLAERRMLRTEVVHFRECG